MLMIDNTKFKRIIYSFVIAFVFWFFIKSEETYIVNLDIPLVARNLQEQKTYKEEVPESIFITLKGTGRSFIWLRVFQNFYKSHHHCLKIYKEHIFEAYSETHLICLDHQKLKNPLF